MTDPPPGPLKDALVYAEEEIDDLSKQLTDEIEAHRLTRLRAEEAEKERDTALWEAEDAIKYSKAAEAGAAYWKAECAKLDLLLRNIAHDLSELAETADNGAWPESRLLTAMDELATRCIRERVP